MDDDVEPLITEHPLLTPEEIVVVNNLRTGRWNTENLWNEQIERYGAAAVTLLAEIADTYADGIDWHIVGNNADVMDWFEPRKGYRWHLLVDVGGKRYPCFAVEMLGNSGTLEFAGRYGPEGEHVQITYNLEADMEKLRAIAFNTFAHGRAGKIHVQRRGLLSPTYRVTMETAKGEIEMMHYSLGITHTLKDKKSQSL